MTPTTDDDEAARFRAAYLAANPDASLGVAIAPIGDLQMVYFPPRGDRRGVVIVPGGPGLSRHMVAPEPDGAVSLKLFTEEMFCTSPPPLPDSNRVLHALAARTAALSGFDKVIDGFSREIVGRSGPRWREAVSTALLGDWDAPLLSRGELRPDVLRGLRREAEQIHRQLLPLWRRRTGGQRVLLLDTPLSEDLTLYDVLAATPHLHSPRGDARLAAVLEGLQPGERAIVYARAQPGVATWAEAAWLTGATPSDGERVRRKVKRLAARVAVRNAA